MAPPDLGVSGRAAALVLGLPMNPLEKGTLDAEDSASELLANKHVLSISQELFNEAKSEGARMLVRVTMLEMTSSLLLTLVVEALKKVVK